jgi:HTH-type transcriptional regulator/antitoxin HigA
MITKIRTEEDYNKVMQLIEHYLSKSTENGGFHTLAIEEKKELKKLSLLAEAYEDSIPLMPIRQPQDLPEMIEYKMYQMQLKQKELALLLGIAPSRLSEVLKGKRKVNMDLAKRLRDRLGIDADFILENA